MRTEETTIIQTEFIYDDEEQARLLEIQRQLEHLAGCDAFSSEKMQKLVEEMKDILNGEWERPLPF